MKAVIFRQHGDLDIVEFADAAKPVIGPDEVLLQVKAAALNQLDLWVLQGWPGLNLKLPHVMGSDGAGVIVEMGGDVTGFSLNDPVVVNPTLSCGSCQYCLTGRDNMCDSFALIGEHVDGFLAEYTTVPARNLMKIPTISPTQQSFEQAAAASLVYVTAWHSLISRGKLQAGESVLIVGAGGGVNTAAIQVARLAGAAPIIVVGSTDKKLAVARQLGADVTINRTQEIWDKAVFNATGRQGVDVVVDNVGAATFHASIRSLRKGGRLLTVGNTSGPKLEIDNRYVFGKHLTIVGSTMGTIADYRAVMTLVFDGRLQPVIDTIYPLAEAKTALGRLKQGQMSGKLLLRP